MAWAITALGLASPLVGEWVSGGTVGTWAGVADGITLIMPAHGAGADTPTTAAPIGDRIHITAGDTVAITVDILATVSTKTAATWLPGTQRTAVPTPVQPVYVVRQMDGPFPVLPHVAMQ